MTENERPKRQISHAKLTGHGPADLRYRSAGSAQPEIRLEVRGIRSAVPCAPHPSCHPTSPLSPMPPRARPTLPQPGVSRVDLSGGAASYAFATDLSNDDKTATLQYVLSSLPRDSTYYRKLVTLGSEHNIPRQSKAKLLIAFGAHQCNWACVVHRVHAENAGILAAAANETPGHSPRMYSRSVPYPSLSREVSVATQRRHQAQHRVAAADLADQQQRRF
ncbi:hypothetical protein HMN09_01242600 [Mycena chlorophos]|uniref:Uncharacterized protein n=1 Tax=Mycena chlorophos TaxID=658473 RepID=A0A8H6VS58_MYCCL|nr:hypothetical protein HMN09_01242600 [Mycena chlorophos]